MRRSIAFALSLGALLFAASQVACAQTDPGFAGRWSPDHEANRLLRPAPDDATGETPPKRERGGGPGGRGGPPPGGGFGEGGPPGGGKGGPGHPPPEGGRGRGFHHDDGPAAELLTPLAQDLLIEATSDGYSFGVEGGGSLVFPSDGTPVELADGSATASLIPEGGALTLEIVTGTGRRITHLYRLEGDGARLRILSQIAEPEAPKAREIQRLYRRAE